MNLKDFEKIVGQERLSRIVPGAILDWFVKGGLSLYDIVGLSAEEFRAFPEVGQTELDCFVEFQQKALENMEIMIARAMDAPQEFRQIAGEDSLSRIMPEPLWEFFAQRDLTLYDVVQIEIWRMRTYRELDSKAVADFVEFRWQVLDNPIRTMERATLVTDGFREIKGKEMLKRVVPSILINLFLPLDWSLYEITGLSIQQFSNVPGVGRKKIADFVKFRREVLADPAETIRKALADNPVTTNELSEIPEAFKEIKGDQLLPIVPSLLVKMFQKLDYNLFEIMRLSPDDLGKIKGFGETKKLEFAEFRAKVAENPQIHVFDKLQALNPPTVFPIHYAEEKSLWENLLAYFEDWFGNLPSDNNNLRPEYVRIRRAYFGFDGSVLPKMVDLANEYGVTKARIEQVVGPPELRRYQDEGQVSMDKRLRQKLEDFVAQKYSANEFWHVLAFDSKPQQERAERLFFFFNHQLIVQKGPLESDATFFFIETSTKRAFEKHEWAIKQALEYQIEPISWTELAEKTKQLVEDGQVKFEIKHFQILLSLPNVLDTLHGEELRYSFRWDMLTGLSPKVARILFDHFGHQPTHAEDIFMKYNETAVALGIPKIDRSQFHVRGKNVESCGNNHWKYVPNGSELDQNLAENTQHNNDQRVNARKFTHNYVLSKDYKVEWEEMARALKEAGYPEYPETTVRNYISEGVRHKSNVRSTIGLEIMPVMFEILSRFPDGLSEKELLNTVFQTCNERNLTVGSSSVLKGYLTKLMDAGMIAQRNAKHFTTGVPYDAQKINYRKKSETREQVRDSTIEHFMSTDNSPIPLRELVKIVKDILPEGYTKGILYKLFDNQQYFEKTTKEGKTEIRLTNVFFNSLLEKHYDLTEESPPVSHQVRSILNWTDCKKRLADLLEKSFSWSPNTIHSGLNAIESVAVIDGEMEKWALVTLLPVYKSLTEEGGFADSETAALRLCMGLETFLKNNPRIERKGQNEKWKLMPKLSEQLMIEIKYASTDDHQQAQESNRALELLEKLLQYRYNYMLGTMDEMLEDVKDQHQMEQIVAEFLGAYVYSFWFLSQKRN